MGKKSSKPPKVEEAAEIEGQYARETARDVTYADRPDQTSPLGNVRWTTEQVTDPATGELVTKWIQNNTLAPGLQGTVDDSIGFMGTRSGLAGDAYGRAEQEMAGSPQWDQFGDPINFNPDEQRAAAEQSSYDRSIMRLDPQFNQAQEQLDIRLRNQGLRPGDEAYDSATQNFMRGKNDAYERARLGASAEGRQEFGVSLEGNERANALRDKQIQEYLAKRGFSLAEAEKLTEGQTAKDISELVS